MTTIMALPNEIIDSIFALYADLDEPILLNTSYFRQKLCGGLCGAHPWILVCQRLKNIAERWFYRQHITLDLSDLGIVGAASMLHDGAGSVRFMLQNVRRLRVVTPRLEAFDGRFSQQIDEDLASIWTKTHAITRITVDAGNVGTLQLSDRTPHNLTSTLIRDTFRGLCRFSHQHNVQLEVVTTPSDPQDLMDPMLRSKVLNAAAAEGSLSVVRALLAESSAAIESKDYMGRTLLSLATIHGHEDTVDYLCCLGASTNTRDDEGNTPLMHAVLMQRQGLVARLLRTRGIDPNVAGPNGKTAFLLAIEVGNETIVQTLLETVKTDPNRKDLFRNTAPHVAVRAGHIDIVSLLLKLKEVDFDQTDQHGRSVLHYAARSGKLGLVKLLLGSGRCSVSSDNEGKTPVQYAIKRADMQIIAAFLGRGSAA